MPQYFSPGVYVEEVDAGPKPIEGVSTSICGAVGVTARGPTAGKPLLVTSFADFTRNFGGFLSPPDPATIAKWTTTDDGGRYWQFPLAVKAFFDNGGQQLYVKRVLSKDATPASAPLGSGFVAEITKDTARGATVLTLRHLINVQDNSQLTVFWGIGRSAKVKVTAFDETSGTITVDPPIPAPLSVKNGDYVVIYDTTQQSPPADADKTVSFLAKAQGQWGHDLRIRVRPIIGATYSLLVDPSIAANPPAVTTVAKDTGAAPVDTITVKDSTPFHSQDHVVIGGIEYTIDTVTAPDQIKIQNLKLTATIGTPVRQLRKASNATKSVSVWGGSAIYEKAIVELSNLHGKETFTVDKVEGNVVTLSKAPTKQYYEGHKLRIIEAEVTVQYAPDNIVVTEEVFSNLSLSDTGANYLVGQVTGQSKLVDVTVQNLSVGENLAKFPAAPINGQWQALTESGDDSLNTLSTDDFVGIDGGSGKRTGIQSFEDIDEISIVIAPGMWSTVVQSALITQCELLKSRFAILDPRDGLDIENIKAFRSPIDTKYAALYYPWVVVRDPSVSRDVAIAPSGHMAGIYARVDDSRGVFKAPANEVILGIQGLEQDITKREQDILNPLNINVLRYFPTRSNRVWGARVLTSDASWKYVPVRRLFIYVEQSIDQGTQFVVFEPNDEPLWARVRQTITNFLTTVWRSGALQGGKPDEAFFVKCDHTTMTQDDIDNGRLICLIGIAPVKPAEFVIFRIQQKTLDQVTVTT
ncbi:hypothetical protein LMG28614_00714 [Paraburkholderia ultramafica]|uniref:Phage tail protein n=1 Tax=Paraburkholderia ultramafica TaxID=1544867 RepID=A0A6S7AUX4_9BURK|nr:phage tail sheath C-terminal domain-containing protein [Paraburkholderia ultramafica]CAB3778750.1 hypothetical protein LMG28614_00714 [Paraburkholderia ultramafica]